MTDWGDEVYREDDPSVSFFADIAAVAAGVDPTQARARLLLHSKREEDRLQQLQRSAVAGLQRRGITPQGDTSMRALAAQVPGSGAEMSPPDWMVQRWASIARAAAPLRGLVTLVPLPSGTMELHVPRFVTSGGVVPERFENVNPANTEPTTDEVVVKVATIAGETTLSQQQADRGGMFADHIILQELAESYSEDLQSQLVQGTGKDGQMLGLLNVSSTAVDGVPGARVVTYTQGSPTPSGVMKAVAECAGQISTVRKRPPSAILARGSRYFWASGSPDGSGNEPVQRPGTGVVPTESDTGPFGPWASLPVYLDETLPVNLGASANQEAIAVVRAKDLILCEDIAPRFSAFPEGNAAGQLTVTLTFRCYVAAIPHLFPSAIGVVTGSGLAVPSGF